MDTRTKIKNFTIGFITSILVMPIIIIILFRVGLISISVRDFGTNF